MPGLTPEKAAEFEASFRARWPAYEEWLDEGRVRDAVQPRFAAARRVEEPFPHVFVEDLLPQPLYQLLEDAWPPDDVFREKGNRRKRDLVPREDPESEYSAGFPTLPESIRAIWRFYVHIVNRGIIGPWLSNVFAAEVRTRLDLLQELQQQGRVGFEASGLASRRYEANSGRLMMRGMGYKLKPHIDPASYLVTALHYFGADNDAECGTVLYKSDRSIPVEAFVARGTTEYFHEHGSKARAAAKMPFLPNAFLAFPNLLNAAHGVVAPMDGYRKVFQYHLSLKSDQEPL